MPLFINFYCHLYLGKYASILLPKTLFFSIISSAANNATIFDNIDCSLVIIRSCWLNPNLVLKFTAGVVLQLFALQSLPLKIFYKVDGSHNLVIIVYVF